MALLLKLGALLNSKRDLALFFIRLTLGLIFLQTGWGKLTHLSDTTVFFQSLSLPFPYYNAILASLTEFFGGILLVLGLCTRVIVLPLSIVMAVAILSTQLGHIGSLSDFIRLQEWDYILCFILLFFSGAGTYSLDQILKRLLTKSYFGYTKK